MGKTLRQRQSAAATLREIATKHGLSGHALYYIHKGMLERCYKEGSASWWHYGARGIGVHRPWHDLITFVREIEALIGPRPLGKTLDRLDPRRDYEPGNVDWATPKEQAWRRDRWRRGPTVFVPTMACMCGSDCRSSPALCLVEQLPWDEAGRCIRSAPEFLARPIAPPLPSIVQHVHTGNYVDCFACATADPVPDDPFFLLVEFEHPEDWCARNVGRSRGLLGFLGC